MSKHIDIGRSGGSAPIVFKSREPVSVICVASTFTVVSYANNGGKVQLSSAGVHGLTTSPAVGASVYVSWSGGTGVSGLYTVLAVVSTTTIIIDLEYVTGLGTPTVAIASTEITMATITIPPLASQSNILCHNLWTMTQSTNTKSFISRLNNTVIQYYNISSTQITARFITHLWNKGTTQAQASSPVFSFPNASSPNYELTKDTAVPTSLTLSGKLMVANEIIRLDNYLVEIFI